MFSSESDAIKLLPEQIHTLSHTQIDTSSPGTILHDFHVLLNLVKEKPLTLTNSEQLGLHELAEINNRLMHPVQLALKRPQQKSYPHIHGLFLLLRASSLMYVDSTDKKLFLLVEQEVYEQWIKLNPTEQYCTLLETWFLRGKPEIVGERPRMFEIIPDNFRETASFYSKIPPDGLPVAGNRDVENWLKYNPGWHNLGLLDLFGLIQVDHASPEPGKGWRIKTIYRSPLGDALLTALYVGFFQDIEKIFRLEDEGALTVGVWQPILQPYFQEWKNNLIVANWVGRQGNCTFKVSLGTVWRRLEIDASQLLDALASIILAAFQFDSDHLYQFSYRNRFGETEIIAHPYLEEGQFTSEVRIGEVPIRIGQAMTFLFDFGDNWEFDVKLEKVDPNVVVKQARILEKHGKAPEQYPSWDD